MGNVFGLLELRTPILCRKEVLGKKFRTKIKDVDVTLILPSFDETKEGKTGMGHSLTSPELFDKMKRGDEPLYWGYVKEYPSGISNVTAIALDFELDTSDTEKIKIAQNEIGSWEGKFFDLVYLITKQSIFGGTEMSGSNSSIELFSLPDKEYIRTIDPNPIVITVTLESENSAISVDNMKEILNALSTGKNLKIDYQLLLEAYQNKKDKKYRQSVIDAAVGFEICMSNQIRSLCDRLEINSDKLLKGKTLGSLVSLFEILGIETDSTILGKYKKNIVEQRNKVAHYKNKSQTPSANDVNTMIKEVSDFLEKYSPDYLE